MKSILIPSLSLLIIFESFLVAQPSNDACTNAITLSVNSCSFVSGTLQNATQSTSALSCNGSTSSSAFDVWYKFVATSTSHKITVSPCANLDAVVELRSGSCLGTKIDCSDNGGGPGGIEFIHYSSFTIGSTYYIRVYASPGPIPSNPCFDIYVISSSPVANDQCSGAITLTPSSSCNLTSGSVGGATPSGLAKANCDICVSPNPHLEDVWYKFTASSNGNYDILVTPSTCTNVYGFDPVIDLYSTCPGSISQSINCKDLGGGYGQPETLSFSAVQGTTYYIRVYDCGILRPIDPLFSICITNSCSPVSNSSVQPQNQTVTEGGTATFNVSVNGSPPFSYFWYRNNIFTNVSTINTSSNTNSYTTPILNFNIDNGSNYYCLVTNCNSTQQVQSNTATLTVQEGCTAPYISNPLSATNLASMSFTANWSLSSNATSYQIDLSTNSTFTNFIYNNLNVGNVTTYNFSNLNCNSTYYYRVRALNQCGNSSVGSYTTVTTNSCCTSPANPPTPSVSNINCTSATLTRSNPPSGVIYYWQGTSCGTNTNLGSGTTFTATASGTYYIRAFNSTASCWANGCTSVNVTLSSAPSLAITPNPASYFTGDPFILTATDIPGATYTWTGNVGNPLPGTTKILNLGTATLSMSGQYCVTATLAGCSSSSCTQVTVSPASTPIVNSLIVTNVTGKAELPNMTIYFDNNLSNSNDPIKVCADGSTATYFKISVTGDRAKYGFKILNADGTEITIPNDEKYGILGTQYPLYTNEIEVAYTAPTHVIGNITHMELRLGITYNGNTLSEINQPLHIYRAPVVFVHGYSGRFTAFVQMRDYLEDSNLYPNQRLMVQYNPGEVGFNADKIKEIQIRYFYNPLLHLIDYSFTNTSSFYQNSRKNVISKGIDSVLSSARTSGYSCSKAILVCHSMGGILTRLYLQSTYPDVNPFKYDIQKLITISTPHLGSQFANLACDESINLKQVLHEAGFEAAIAFWLNKSPATLDMRIDSDELAKLNIPNSNQNKIPSHTITNIDEFSTEILSKSNPFPNYLPSTHEKILQKIKFYYKNQLLKRCGLYGDIFLGEKNDGVVPIRSQQTCDAFSLTETLLFHEDETRSIKVKEKVKDLILESPSSNNFSLNGFSKTNLQYINLNCNLNVSKLKPLLLDSVKIIYPNSMFKIFSGNSFELNYTRSAGIIFNDLIILNSDSISIIHDTLNQKYIINVGSTEVGKKFISLYGIDSLYNIYQDSITIDIISSSSINSILIDPKKITIPLGYEKELNIYGFFKDGSIKSINTYPNCVFHFDSSIIKFSNNVIKAVKYAPLIYLIAECEGKKDTCAITITDEQHNNITDFSTSKFNICENESINLWNISLGNPTEFKWILKGTNTLYSFIENPIALYTKAGSYDVKLICKFRDYYDSLEVKNYITVLPSPLVNLGPPKITPTCSTTLDAANLGCSYQWSTGETSRKIYPSKTGMYLVTVTNEHGCKSTDSIEVVLSDNIKPTVTTQNTFVYLNSLGQATITPDMVNKGSSDNCGIASMSVTPNAFTCKNRGPNKVILTVTDLKGNTATASATVNVIDLEVPTITCPPNLSITAKAGQCTVPSTSVNLLNPVVSDNCNIKNPITKNTVSSFPIGVTNIIWTVSDSSLNTKTCTQTVTVLPSVCGVPTGVSYYDTTSSSAKIKWLGVSCANSYLLSIRQELTPGVWGSWTENIVASGPGLTHSFTGLNSGKKYNFQLKSICGTIFSIAFNGYFRTKASSLGDLGSRSEEVNNSNSSNLNPSITVIPNPARENARVLIEGFGNHPKEVIMYNLSGQLIFKIEIDPKEYQLELDPVLLNMHSGVYLIRVSSGSLSRTEQFIFQE